MPTPEPSSERLLIPVEIPYAANVTDVRATLIRINRLIAAQLDTGLSEDEITRRLHGWRPSGRSSSDWPPREAQP